MTMTITHDDNTVILGLHFKSYQNSEALQTDFDSKIFMKLRRF